MFRVAAKAEAEERKDAWQRTAVMSYWIYVSIPTRKGKRKMDMRQWMRQFGLADQGQNDNEDVESIKRRAAEVQSKVIELSRRKRPRRSG